MPPIDVARSWMTKLSSKSKLTMSKSSWRGWKEVHTGRSRSERERVVEMSGCRAGNELGLRDHHLGVGTPPKNPCLKPGV
jgi:hypothetical protein